MKNQQIGVILQARMGSKRLPGKVVRQIGGKTILQHILDRYFASGVPYELVLATSNLKRDDVIANLAGQNKITLFRGNEKNVLSRYLFAARKYDFDHVIRLTADNILTDYSEMRRLVSLHLSSAADYSRSLGSVSGLPTGVGTEIFTYQTLERLSHEATELNHLEDVNGYIEDNAELFNISELIVPESKKKPTLSLTVDTFDDLKKMQLIFEKHNNTWPEIEKLI